MQKWKEISEAVGGPPPNPTAHCRELLTRKSLVDSQEIMCLNTEHTLWLLGNKGSRFICNITHSTSAKANACLMVLSRKIKTHMNSLHPFILHLAAAAEAPVYLRGPRVLLAREGANELTTTSHCPSKHLRGGINPEPFLLKRAKGFAHPGRLPCSQNTESC